MTQGTHSLNRSVTIEASPETVFRFFTDDTRWAAWWGAGSSIEARPGGAVRIRYPNGVEAAGTVLEVAAPERIVFSYGYLSGQPIGPGASRVTIRLERAGQATRLHLSHDFTEVAAQVRDEHVQGWRYQLSLFGNIVADEVNAGATTVVDAWFRAWGEPDAAAREGAFARIAAPELRFRDRYSLVDGLGDLLPHVAASQRFMPGIRLQRDGDVRHCQGIVLADWTALGKDDKPRGRGTNVFVFGPDGRIVSATGFWASPT